MVVVVQLLLCLTLWNPMNCSMPGFMEFSRQEYWSELSLPYPEAHPRPGIESTSPALAGGFFTTGPPGKPLIRSYFLLLFSLLLEVDWKRSCWDLFQSVLPMFSSKSFIVSRFRSSLHLSLFLCMALRSVLILFFYM